MAQEVGGVNGASTAISIADVASFAERRGLVDSPGAALAQREARGLKDGVPAKLQAQAEWSQPAQDWAHQVKRQLSRPPDEVLSLLAQVEAAWQGHAQAVVNIDLYADGPELRALGKQNPSRAAGIRHELFQWREHHVAARDRLLAELQHRHTSSATASSCRTAP